jgi:hypothetical protein
MSSPPAETSNRMLFTQQGLQDLRAKLFQLERSAIHQMIANGVDGTNISVLADLDRAIEAVERLQLPTRERA